jgi:hypothetical protein
MTIATSWKVACTHDGQAGASAGERRPEECAEHYRVEEAFKHLNRSPALTLDQKAGLEFAYIEVLARPWDRRDTYGIPNLERYVEAHPELFVQAVAWTYKRKDGATDPPSSRSRPSASRPWPSAATSYWRYRAHPRPQRPWRTGGGSPRKVDRNRSPIVRRTRPPRHRRRLHRQGAVVRSARTACGRASRCAM